MISSDIQNNKILVVMKNFVEQYVKCMDIYFCSDFFVIVVVIEGLVCYKEELGFFLCFCCYYEDKEVEVKNIFWNCFCVFMWECKECYCMLFLILDNDFVGDVQDIFMEILEEVKVSMVQIFGYLFYEFIQLVICVFFFCIFFDIKGKKMFLLGSID